MTVEPELTHFVGSADELRRAVRRFDVVELCLLVDTFPWWKRALARLFWRTRLRRAFEGRYRSPYGLVVATLTPIPVDRLDPDERIRAEAGQVLERDRLSRERSVPGATSVDGAS